MTAFDVSAAVENHATTNLNKQVFSIAEGVVPIWIGEGSRNDVVSGATTEHIVGQGNSYGQRYAVAWNGPSVYLHA